MSTRLMLALRIVLSSSFGAAIIESGTGATYITETGLKKLLIPSRVSSHYESEYRSYVAAVRRRDFEQMISVESIVRESMLNVDGLA